MSLYKRQDYGRDIARLNSELVEWNRWKQLANEHKWFVEFLSNAMEATMLQTDDDEEFRAVRAKFRTLKEIRDSLIKAEKEVNWRHEEIARLDQLK